MRTLLNLLFIVGFFSIGNSTYAQAKLTDWAELVAFHKVMSQTFHPSEEGNLEPIKTRIGEMVEKAKALQASTPPADFKNKKVKKAVATLVKDSKALEAKIKAGATDEEIKTALTALHDTFHQIVGLCSENTEKDHEHKEGAEHDHKH